MSKKLLVVLSIAGLGGVALWTFSARQSEPSVLEDPGFYHTAQGVHYRINELRDVLSDGLENDELHVIHDHMYYFEGLLDAFWKKLDSDEKERTRAVLARMRNVARELDGFAGRGKRKATGVSLEKMFGLMDELDATYGAAAGTPAIQK